MKGFISTKKHGGYIENTDGAVPIALSRFYMPIKSLEIL
jgi:hypothetical protein